jgi:acyl-CoA thioester hydrolase
MKSEFETRIRVRYDEADPMGFVHHANYLRYFEYARTEMLRAGGGSYRDVEASGVFVVVVQANVKYRAPARYDDLLTVAMRVSSIGNAKVEHEYEIRRAESIITQATLTLAVVDRDGNVQRVPDWMKPTA